MSSMEFVVVELSAVETCDSGIRINNTVNHCELLTCDFLDTVYFEMDTRKPEQQSSACELSSKMSLSEATSMVSTVSLETTTQISTPKVRNYLSSDIVLTRYTCEELMITGKPNQRTNAEKNAKNYFNKTIRKAVYEYDLQNIKDKRTYKTVEQVILSYNPSLCEKENNTKELMMIRKVVCSRLKYNRYISRKHNGLLGENKKDTEE